MSKNNNVGLILNFDLLGTNLNAAYEKVGDNHKALLLPSDIEASEAVSLGEVVKSLKEAVGVDIPAETIKGQVNSADKGGKFDWEKITFQLKAAYFYAYKEGSKELVNDYAFAVKIDLSDAVPDLGFLKVNSIGLAVWNTTRQAILTRMNMGSIDNLLLALEASK